MSRVSGSSRMGRRSVMLFEPMCRRWRVGMLARGEMSVTLVFSRVSETRVLEFLSGERSATGVLVSQSD